MMEVVSSRSVVYPGSLDPITFGHLSSIRDVAETFDDRNVVVAVGINPEKKYMFSLCERESLARQGIESVGIKGVTVTSFSGLLVDFLIRNGWDTVVRGVRNGKDLDDAMLQENIGWEQTMAKRIKAFYAPTRQEHGFTSSSALKSVLKDQGKVTHMAPMSTIHAVQARMLGQYFFGITGVSGAGKSFISKKFKAIADRRHIPLFHIDLDEITRKIYAEETEPVYRNVRRDVEAEFGPGLLDSEGFINDESRRKLGQIVFGSPEKLKRLNDILHEPIFFRMKDLLRRRKGVFLIDAALFAETDKTSMVNNQLLLVAAEQKDLPGRLVKRDELTQEQIARRLSSQFSTEAKLLTIRKKIQESSYGHVECLTNDDSLSEADIEKAFDNMLKQVDIYGELRISSFFEEIGVGRAEEAYHALRKLYAGDDRFYHSLAHVVDGLNIIPEFAAELKDSEAFTLAWLFHDAVYDSREKDNEEKSAELLESMCNSWGVDALLIGRAKRLVLMTKHGIAKPVSLDDQFIVDLDMSVLGKAAPEFDQYEKNLFREYEGVSRKDWAAGRGQFLSMIKPPYFHTDYFVGEYAERAEMNVQRSLERLAR